MQTRADQQVKAQARAAAIAEAPARSGTAAQQSIALPSPLVP
jgi:hypothetical protein